MTSPAAPPRRVVVQTAVSLGAQGVLVLLGLGVVVADDDPTSNILLLTTWCLFATAYTIVTLVLLGREARRATASSEAPPTLQISDLARILTIVGTLLPSLIGVIAAGQVIFSRDDEEWGQLYAAVGVWAMLASWGLLHWGYAQIYLQRYYRSLYAGGGPTMTFPGTEHPRIVDFVYFSFTLGTSFATSDVTLRTTATRWLSTWHSVVAFFFNGLIIVFALGTIVQR